MHAGALEAAPLVYHWIPPSTPVNTVRICDPWAFAPLHLGYPMSICPNRIPMGAICSNDSENARGLCPIPQDCPKYFQDIPRAIAPKIIPLGACVLITQKYILKASEALGENTPGIL